MRESTMIALTLEVAAIGILLVVLAVGFVYRQAARAPKGFENSDGFHFGAEPRPQGITHRRKRALVAAVATADDREMPVQIHHIPPAQAAL
jgi:hypothetical protein